MHWTLMRERSDILAVLFRNRRSSIDNNKCQLYLRGLRPVGKGGKGAIPPYFSRSKSKTFSLKRPWITARPRLPDFQTFLRPLIWYAEHFASSWELRVAHFLHSICNIMAFSVHIWLIRINVKKSRSLLYCLSYWLIRYFNFVSPSVCKIQSKFQNAALWLLNRNDLYALILLLTQDFYLIQDFYSEKHFWLSIYYSKRNCKSFLFNLEVREKIKKL